MRLIKDSIDPYARRYRVAKWNVSVTVCEVQQLFRVLPEFTGWTKVQHETAAREYAAQSQALDQQWRETIDQALASYGNGTGVTISGVYRDHFPEVVKDALRSMAHTATDRRDRSRAHWLACGRRLDTWRLMIQQ